jgi:hypothetical protein
MKVRLTLKSGAFVAEVNVPATFKIPPDVLIWQGRTFQYAFREYDRLVYSEAFVFSIEG